jgi:formylglycine-generating enzyme required for sulfatase activity
VEPELITTQVASIKLKRVPAGTFLMGSPEDDKDADNDEKPQHRVRITRPFYLGMYEVTQAQYEAVMGKNPSAFKANGMTNKSAAGQSTEMLPVEEVSWLDAVRFCNKLGEMEGRAAFYEIDGENVRAPGWKRVGFRLPTEAEWEYACRANAPTVTRFSFGDNAASLNEFGWSTSNAVGKTHPVGRFQPNPFGLYDMHGNVWEWCWDGYGADYYKESPENDPRGRHEVSVRVFRGGGWGSIPRSVRSAARHRRELSSRGSYLGLRLALVQSVR